MLNFEDVKLNLSTSRCNLVGKHIGCDCLRFTRSYDASRNVHSMALVVADVPDTLRLPLVSIHLEAMEIYSPAFGIPQ